MPWRWFTVASTTHLGACSSDTAHGCNNRNCHRYLLLATRCWPSLSAPCNHLPYWLMCWSFYHFGGTVHCSHPRCRSGSVMSHPSYLLIYKKPILLELWNCQVFNLAFYVTNWRCSQAFCVWNKLATYRLCVYCPPCSRRGRFSMPIKKQEAWIATQL